MFRLLLILEDGEPPDPAVFVTPFSDWRVGESFVLGDGERWRIRAIDTNISDELVEEGFSAVFTVALVGAYLLLGKPARIRGTSRDRRQPINTEHEPGAGATVGPRPRIGLSA